MAFEFIKTQKSPSGTTQDYYIDENGKYWRVFQGQDINKSFSEGKNIFPVTSKPEIDSLGLTTDQSTDQNNTGNETKKNKITEQKKKVLQDMGNTLKPGNVPLNLSDDATPYQPGKQGMDFTKTYTKVDNSNVKTKLISFPESFQVYVDYLQSQGIPKENITAENVNGGVQVTWTEPITEANKPSGYAFKDYDVDPNFLNNFKESLKKDGYSEEQINDAIEKFKKYGLQSLSPQIQKKIKKPQAPENKEDQGYIPYSAKDIKRELAGLPAEYINAYAQLAAGKKGTYKAPVFRGRNQGENFLAALLGGGIEETVNQMEKSISAAEGKSDFMNKIVPALEKATGKKFTGMEKKQWNALQDEYKENAKTISGIDSIKVDKRTSADLQRRANLIQRNDDIEKELKADLGDKFDIEQPDFIGMQNVARAEAMMPVKKQQMEYKAFLDRIEESEKQKLRLLAAKSMAEFKAKLAKDYGITNNDVISQIVQMIQATPAQNTTQSK